MSTTQSSLESAAGDGAPADEAQGSLSLASLTKTFGQGDSAVTAVDHVDLDILPGEFITLLGPSGCGKTTTLRMIAGFEDATSGEVLLDGENMVSVPPNKRPMSMVFQSYALFPHLSVRENVAYGLRLRKMPDAQVDEAVDVALAAMNLTAMAGRAPSQLSGGQQQRVALARAMVVRPKVLLFDEPLSNLDAKLRVSTRTQIAALQRRLGVTTVYVTHDQVEAMTMGDRVAVMKDGILQQVDSPLALYDTPKNLFVAGFIGSPAMNLMEGTVVDGGVKIGDYVVPIGREVLAKAEGESALTLGIRPEAFRISTDGQGIGLDIAVVEELGADSYLYGTLAGLSEEELVGAQQIVARVGARQAPAKGETVRLAADPSQVHVFSNKTEERIS